MIFAIFNSLQSAESFQSAVDAELGYPKSPTAEVGSGVFVDDAAAVTLHEFEIIKHYNAELWACPIPEGTEDLVPEDAEAVVSIAEFFPVL